jgi:hypothetical protein
MTPPPDPGADLRRRRELLLARSARLRDEIAEDANVIRRGAGLVDRGVGLVDRGAGLLGRARSTGLLVPLALAGGLLLAAGPSRVLRVAGRALAMWPLVRPLVRPLMPHVATLLAARRATARSERLR